MDVAGAHCYHSSNAAVDECALDEAPVVLDDAGSDTLEDRGYIHARDSAAERRIVEDRVNLVGEVVNEL